MNAITVEALSKRYSLGVSGPQYMTLRDAIVSGARRIVGRRTEKHTTDEFFALRDVSFTVQTGEVVGIIGSNGAGKSTLLKILSRITWPTSGQATVRGRVGSLLEVGTGFNLELTGRENVFLNGAILGMTRADVRRKFDEIVAFSGVERFIDTPVKYYSSGMHMRLAFSVAAHLEPEVLFVDEVLAVGDAEFQQRCLSKIREVGSDGRTVLLVTHSMEALTRLCRRALYLQKGHLVDDGGAELVASRYMQLFTTARAERRWEEPSAPGDATVRLRSVRVVDEERTPVEAVDLIRPFGIEMKFDVLAGDHVLVPKITFTAMDGTCLFWAFEVDSEWHKRSRAAGTYTTTAWVPAHLLSEGFVRVGVAIHTLASKTTHFSEEDVVAFQAFEKSGDLTARGDFSGHIQGAVRPLLRWTTDVGSLSTEGAAAER